MKQGIQSALKRNRMIVEYGCYFLCLLELSERLTGRPVEDERIYDLYFDFVNEGAMKKDCVILDPAWIMERLTGRRFEFSRPVDKPDYPYYIIEKVKPGYTHFTLFHKGEEWDSLDPARSGAKGYKPNSHRLLREVS